MKPKDSVRIRIGLPKGSIHQKACDFLNNSLKLHATKERLFYQTPDYDIFFLKHRDIAKMIKEQRLDFGITSEEWLYEKEVDYIMLKKLDWCHTHMGLIVPMKNSSNINNCATEFYNVAKKYFSKEDKNNIEIYTISGSSEALVPNMFDSCIDCIETGNTLKSCQLKETDIIFESDIVCVAHCTVTNEQINKFVSDFLD